MAATWYALSYVPFGRKVVISFLRKTICKPCFQIYDARRANSGSSTSNNSLGSGHKTERESNASDTV